MAWHCRRLALHQAGEDVANFFLVELEVPLGHAVDKADEKNNWGDRRTSHANGQNNGEEYCGTEHLIEVQLSEADLSGKSCFPLITSEFAGGSEAILFSGFRPVEGDFI